MAYFSRLKQKPCLGVELKEGRARAVLFKPGKTNRFECYEALSDDSDTLAQLVNEHGLKKISCAFALPDRLAFTAVLNVASDLKGSLLEQQLLFEVHQQLPDALESMSYDYQFLKTEGGQQSLYFVAAKTADVEQANQDFLEAGLLPKRAETVQLALIRAVLSEHPNERSFALMLVDHDGVVLSLVDDEIVSYQNEQKREQHSAASLEPTIARLISWLESSGHTLTKRPVYLVGELASPVLAQALSVEHQCQVSCLKVSGIEGECAGAWAVPYGLALGGEKL